MTRCAANVADATSDMLEESLKQERERFRQTNRATGLPEDAGISISVDGQ